MILLMFKLTNTYIVFVILVVFDQPLQCFKDNTFSNLEVMMGIVASFLSHEKYLKVRWSSWKRMDNGGDVLRKADDMTSIT